MDLTGIHHLTAISAAIKENHRFYTQTLGMRLVGQCQLHLRSSDPDQQTVFIYGIPDLEKLADTLRECSLRERKRRRITTLLDA